MIKATTTIFDTGTTIDFNKFQYALKAKSPKGFLDWSYKPFFNMRLNKGETRGSLAELDTEKLNFSLTAPVDMIPQQSYDGSVNLIINDKRNPPRLINSRFTVREKNTYERVDRLGENDTNIYDVDKFQLQTSLQKLYSLIPVVQFNGETPSGNLRVGNYIFYFAYCDADENETDIVAESGVVSIFKGQNKSPNSIDGGFRDENSYKSVSFTLKNIDSEYSYIKVYYVRYSADMNQHRILNAYKIQQKYQVKDNKCNMLITGLEYAEEISEDDINIQYSNISTAGSQAVVQNRLFLGNIEQVDPLYRDLQDVSLRILPSYQKIKGSELIGDVDYRYCDYSVLQENYEYYNSNNIYNYVGYHPGEIYRVGIVYMMNDNSLSPVYNIRGRNKIPEYSEGALDNKYYQHIPLYQDKKNSDDEDVRRYIDCIDETSYEFIDRPDNENSKGVIRIEDNDQLEVYSLRFKISSEVLQYLKGKVKGFFFVRQKRIPTILGQALLLPIEKNSSLPLLPYEKDHDIIEGLMDEDKMLTQEYKQRILKVTSERNSNQGCLIFPEFELDQPYYNTLFTGGEFLVREAYYNNPTNKIQRDDLNERHYYVNRNSASSLVKYNKSRLIQVADNLKLCGIDDYKFSARAGEAEEGFRYEKTNADIESKDAYNYIRGSFGPYVGIVSRSKLEFGKIVDVFIPGYSEAAYNNYFKIRYQDVSSYYAISDRQNLNTIQSFEQNIYRGDSYICNFTHRLNRNFQDPSAPLNDKIVDKNTWKDNFDVSDGVVKKENFEKINLGDLNAIKLGSWITFKVRCSRNLSIRSNDSSIVDEMALFGHPRSFYPLSPMSADGTFKIPESNVYNDAFASTLGVKQYILLPDVPYLKDKFQTRIFYSDIYINDSYINGYRRFLGNAYRDYESQYGGIVKLLPFNRDLICVFEHGIVKLAINQQTPISQNPEEPVFVGAHNVLPENMIVISDTIGSQWKDSILKTDTCIYGVDTHAKKIWRLTQDGLESLSDFKFQQFLNNNITLLENETTPYIGVRNIKTHYNRAKGDVMFTYYDDLNGFSERAWNLCYNEKIQRWVTFYSWIPAFSVNLYNNYFSFDRNTSKYIAKLGLSWEKSNDSTGIVLDSDSQEAPLLDKRNFELSLKDIEEPKVNGVEIDYDYTPHRDIYGFYKGDKNKAENCYDISGNSLVITNPDKMLKIMEKYKMPVALLNISCQVNLKYDASKSTLKDLATSYEGYKNYNSDLFSQTVALTTEQIYNARKQEELQGLNLSSWFWSHGKTGLFDIKDKILPSKWYEHQHPFEFEFIVNANVDQHKIFDNLEIISNNCAPESFHYEIVGDCFEFAKDKKNMYIRQEATKELYQYNGTDITFDEDYSKLESHHRKMDNGRFEKSTLLPLYYSRQDRINTVEDYYHGKDGLPTYDFSNLAGGEILKNSRSNEYSIWNHAKAVSVQDGGRLRGNMHYREDKWYVQINPLNIRQNNEPDWSVADIYAGTSETVPVELSQAPLPNEVLDKGTLDIPDDIPSSFKREDAQRGIVLWDSSKVIQSEAKMKDKWIKIRVRYFWDDTKGEESKLAIIHSVQTLFSISKS